MYFFFPLQFSYSTQAPNITAAFAVIWDVNKPFDNPENIHGNINLFIFQSIEYSILY